MKNKIYHDFISNIEEIIDCQASEDEKEQIIDSLWLILQQQEMKNINKYHNQIYTNNIQNPCINLYMVPFYSLSPQIQQPMMQQQFIQQQMMQQQFIQQQMMQQQFIQQPIVQQQFVQQPVVQQQFIQSPMMQQLTYPMTNFYSFQQLNQQSHKKKHKKEKVKKHKKSSQDKKHKKSSQDKEHKKSDKEEKTNRKELTFSPKPGKNFDGIMRYLTNKTGGNIHDNQTVEITSNSISGTGHPKNLVNYNNESRYQCLMNGRGDAYICFDFKDMRIQLSKYTIQSNNCIGKNWYDLRNWVIEVSDDGKNWNEIDRHSDDPALNGHNIIHTFNVQKPNDGFHRYVRLRQTGKTWSQPGDPYHFFFSYLEFYGKIEIPEKKFKM